MRARALLATVGVLGLAVTGLSTTAGSEPRLVVLLVSPGQNLLHLGLAGWGAAATLRTPHAPPRPGGDPTTPPRPTATRTR